MHLGRFGVDSNAFSVICSIQVLLLWVRIHYFARVLQPTKNPFMDTLRSVIHEVILQQATAVGTSKVHID